MILLFGLISLRPFLVLAFLVLFRLWLETELLYVACQFISKKFLVNLLPLALVIVVQVALVELQESVFNNEAQQELKFFPSLDF